MSDNLDGRDEFLEKFFEDVEDFEDEDRERRGPSGRSGPPLG